MHKKNLSFTLVEILFALAILGIGLVGILSVFVVGTNTVRRAVERTEACFIAQMVFEDFKRQGHLISSNNLDKGIADAAISSYYPSYQVVTTPAQPVLNNSITLDVQKRSNSVSIGIFTSYIARYAP